MLCSSHLLFLFLFLRFFCVWAVDAGIKKIYKKIKINRQVSHTCVICSDFLNVLYIRVQCFQYLEYEPSRIPYRLCSSSTRCRSGNDSVHLLLLFVCGSICKMRNYTYIYYIQNRITYKYIYIYSYIYNFLFPIYIQFELTQHKTNTHVLKWRNFVTNPTHIYSILTSDLNVQHSPTSTTAVVEPPERVQKSALLTARIRAYDILSQVCIYSIFIKINK